MDVDLKKYIGIGYLGGPNIGDESLVLAVLSALNGKSRFIVVSGRPDVTKKMIGVEVECIKGFYPGRDLTFSELWETFCSVKKSDGVLIVGGGVLQNVHSNNLLLHCAFFSSLATILNKKYLGVGVGYGPIAGVYGRMLSGFVLSRFSCLTFRDEISYANAVNDVCGAMSHFCLGLDSAFAFDQIKKEKIENKVGLCFRSWSSLDSKILHDLYVHFNSSGMEIVLMAFEHQDVELYKNTLGKECGDKIVFPQNVAEARELVSTMSFVVSMRLHACIFAAIEQVKFVGLSYDDKVKNVLSEIGLRQNVLNIKSTENQILSCLYSSKILSDYEIVKYRNNVKKSINDAVISNPLKFCLVAKATSFLFIFYFVLKIIVFPRFRYYFKRISQRIFG